jgi:general secretion pathway protein G
MKGASNLNKNQHGFTFIEILVVITIIAVLVALVGPNLFSQKERAYMTKAGAEMNTMRSAINLFLLKYDDYPADVDRNVPPGLEEFVQPNDLDRWPSAPWPGSVYDYDAHERDGEWYFQVSIRFCEIGQPDTCNFPKAEWAENFGVNSSVYYCLEGICRPHPDQPTTYPGYCMNCDNPSNPVFD